MHQFFLPKIYEQKPKVTQCALENGDISRIEFSEWSFPDELFTFLLEEKFFKFAEQSYPNPRFKNEVPVWFLLATQVLLKLHGSQSYSHLGHLLRSGSVLTRVGFNIESTELGFNKKNTKPRKTAVHPDTVRKYFLDTDPLSLRRWYLSMQTWFIARKSIQTQGTFVLDQTRIVVPNNDNYKDAQWLPVDEFGHFSKDPKKAHKSRRCYSLSLLIHTNSEGSHLHVANYKLDGGHTDELTQADIVDEYALKHPGVIRELLVDRGYIDGGMVTRFKKYHNIDLVLPLRKDMESYREAIAVAELTYPNFEKWPVVYEDLKEKVKSPDLKRMSKIISGVKVDKIDLWDTCKVPLFFVVFRNISLYSDGSEKIHYWVLASTKEFSSPVAMYKKYAQRIQIEEINRQQKFSWQIKEFTSPDRSLIEAQVAFTLLTYSAVQLYLRSEEMQAITRAFRSTWSNDERLGKNCVIIYAQDTFMVLDLLTYSTTLLNLTPEAKERMQKVVARLKKETPR